MKTSFNVCIAFLAALIPMISLCAADFDDSKYDVVKKEVIKATPEEYKGKKIAVETRFLKYYTSFPDYMVKSGIKSGKYYCLIIDPANFLVIAKKKDFNDIIVKLKFGQALTVYGRVKKFKRASRAGLPSYYLDCDHIEVGEEKPQTEAKETPQEERPPADGQDQNRWQRRKRAFRRWQQRPQGDQNQPAERKNDLAPTPPDKLK